MTIACEHHFWEQNPQALLLNGDLDIVHAAEFRCHDCPAVGDDCPDCDGFGEIDDEYDGSIEVDCPTCGGRGIVERITITEETTNGTL
jgi:hypothetical protein